MVSTNDVQCTLFVFSEESACNPGVLDYRRVRPGGIVLARKKGDLWDKANLIDVLNPTAFIEQVTFFLFSIPTAVI